MNKIKQFIDFINTNAPQPPGEHIWREHWIEFLDKNMREWRNLVKDKNNWKYFDDVEPMRGSETLYKAMIEVAGLELASFWSKSKIEKQREVAKKMLVEKIILITPEIWNQLTDEVREFIIDFTFDRNPGQPYEFIKEYIGIPLFERIKYYFKKILTYDFIDPFLFPLALPYIPSSEILYLSSLTKAAGDKKFSDLIDKRIEEIKKEIKEGAFSFYKSRRFRIDFNPTPDETELIARIFDKFRKNGFLLSPLPPIFISFETPPLFVAYPELEEEIEGQSDMKEVRQRIPRNRKRGRPETISIEEALGIYVPSNPQIILYQRGLRWFARRYNLDEMILRGIVLVHEIGHWITHLLPKEDVPEWDTELYKLTSNEVHEGWAQLITYWVVEEIGGDIEEVFKELNRHQSYIYKAFERFTDKPIDSVIRSLEYIRKLKWPASISEWEKCLQ